jgi:ABC-type lipoprotein release transport system permease subunit
MQLRRVMPLTDFYLQARSLLRFQAWAAALVMLSVLLLSAAGIYAMMSFTVAQRTREIAIRSALGAAPHRLFLGIFKRATGQLATGVAAGSILSLTMFQNSDRGFGENATFVIAVAAMMIVVGLFAALGPARRGLRIQPSETLRD